MKWILISKAKVKFGQLYLIKPTEKDDRPICGHLAKSETTISGIVHRFAADGYTDNILATHIAIITDRQWHCRKLKSIRYQSLKQVRGLLLR